MAVVRAVAAARGWSHWSADLFDPAVEFVDPGTAGEPPVATVVAQVRAALAAAGQAPAPQRLPRSECTCTFTSQCDACKPEQTDTQRYADAVAEIARLAALLARRERERNTDREALTESEARYLVAFNHLSAIRDTVNGPHHAALPAIVKGLADRLAAVLRLASGRPGYHTITVKQLLAAGVPDDDQAEADESAQPDTSE